MVLIRDVSGYDTDLIPYGDYDGIIPRCYNGTSKDSRFDIHKAGTKAAGKPWWPYSFYNFLYPALKQVQDAVNILQDDPGYLPLAFDVEEWRTWDPVKQIWIWHRYPGRVTLLAGMQTLYANYKALTGLTCQWYMNPATIHYLKPIPDWLLNCPLWIANWLVDHPDFEPWIHYTFWQKRGEPDLNSYYGTDEQYWAYVGGTPPLPPPVPDKVRTTATSLYLRASPGGTMLGYVPLGTILGVTGSALDANGDKWWQIGNCYCASWWTEPIE